MCVFFHRFPKAQTGLELENTADYDTEFLICWSLLPSAGISRRHQHVHVPPCPSEMPLLTIIS